MAAQDIFWQLNLAVVAVTASWCIILLIIRQA
jgi:hypothetical protein